MHPVAVLGCTLCCSAQCTLHSAHCTLHTAHCTSREAHARLLAVWGVWRKLCTWLLHWAAVHSAQCWASQCTLHSAHSQCTVQRSTLLAGAGRMEANVHRLRKCINAKFITPLNLASTRATIHQRNHISKKAMLSCCTFEQSADSQLDTYKTNCLLTNWMTMCHRLIDRLTDYT